MAPAPKRASWWRRWRGRIGLGLLGLLLLLGLVQAWMPKPVVIETATIHRGDVVVEIVEDGRTRVPDRYIVSAPLAGNLLRIDLSPGDPISAGQVVARILPADSPLLDNRTRAETEARLAATLDARRQAEAALSAAEVAAAVAEREAASLRSLAEEGGVAALDLDRVESEARLRREQLASARFAVDVAGHEADVARAVLGRRSRGQLTGMDVSSPVDGRVLRVFQESAGVVGPGTPLLEIGDPRTLEVVVDVLSPQAVRIPTNAVVRIERWGGEVPLDGRVHAVEPQAFTRLSALGIEEQRVNVVIDLVTPREAWAGLGDAFQVDACIETDRREEVLVVPEAAIFRHDGGYAVYRVVENEARLSPVTLGLRNGGLAELSAGLSEGDVVVVYPSEAVVDGVAVAVPE